MADFGGPSEGMTNAVINAIQGREQLGQSALNAGSSAVSNLASFKLNKDELSLKKQDLELDKQESILKEERDWGIEKVGLDKQLSAMELTGSLDALTPKEKLDILEAIDKAEELTRDRAKLWGGRAAVKKTRAGEYDRVVRPVGVSAEDPTAGGQLFPVSKSKADAIGVRESSVFMVPSSSLNP